MQAWTDPNQLSWGYGVRTIRKIIKAPSLLAYIVLICVNSTKLKYNENDVRLYSIFLSKITDYAKKMATKSYSGLPL